LNPLHVVLVTDDPGLAARMSTALSEQAGIAGVEAIAGDAAWPDTRERPDLVILDSASSWTPDPSGRLSADRFPESLVIRLRAGADEAAGLDVESHLLLDEQGFLLREDLDEVAPVVVALAAFLAPA
jgi:DNA-binding NarL/FixJ family response regulator